MEKQGRVDRDDHSSCYGGPAFMGGKKGARICRMVQQLCLSGTGCFDRRFLRSGTGFGGGAVSLWIGGVADLFAC